MLAFRIFPAAGVVALFEEIGASGDPFDIHAPRNAPALSPTAHLDRIYFHSSLDNMEVVVDTSIVIHHAAVAAAAPPALNGQVATVVTYAAGTDLNLYNHNLGYVPMCFAVVDGKVLIPGLPVQTFAGGRGRYMSLWATATQVKLHEWTSRSNLALPAINKTYRILIFRMPRGASGSKAFDFNPLTGITKMAYDRFSSDRRYLQVVAGGTPFSIPFGKMADLKNGAPRFLSGNGTHFDPVPVTQKGRFVVEYYGATYTGAYGAHMAYTGALTLPTQIKVQAP